MITHAQFLIQYMLERAGSSVIINDPALEVANAEKAWAAIQKLAPCPKDPATGC